MFIYDALLDAVICGNTEATAHDIAAKLRYLDQQSHDTPETYLMQEFKVNFICFVIRLNISCNLQVRKRSGG